MANDLGFDQLATVLNEIVSMATGAKAPAVVSTGDFVAVGKMGLLTGYDPLNTAISQVLARTIFSVRPYYAKFRGMDVTNAQWGNHVRKLTMVDPQFQNDDRYTLTDASSPDMYAGGSPKTLQLNFYGAETYSLTRRYYKDQLDSAFSGPDEFAQFITMVTQNASDMIEQAHESTKRLTLSNYVAGVLAAGNPKQVVHLLTEYNAYVGGSYTTTTVKAPDVYPAFIKWCYARIAAISSMLTERLQSYHINVTGSPVSRHTPYDLQRVYILAQDRYSIEAQVLADTYHDNYLRLADNETVNFWQSSTAPDTIYAKPTYLKPDGTLSESEDDVSVSPLFAVLMDRDACGVTIMGQWSMATPMNARGGFTNYWWHFTDKYWNDFTENGVIFLMD